MTQNSHNWATYSLMKDETKALHTALVDLRLPTAAVGKGKEESTGSRAPLPPGDPTYPRTSPGQQCPTAAGGSSGPGPQLHPARWLGTPRAAEQGQRCSEPPALPLWSAETPVPRSTATHTSRPVGNMQATQQLCQRHTPVPLQTQKQVD